MAPATQNQALNALGFLYRNVLARPLGECTGIVRAKRPLRLPVALTTVEVGCVLAKLQGVYWLIGCLQYGSGLRLLESVRLRVKDLDFDHCAILVRHGKGAKDRVVALPDELVVPLKRHLANRKTAFERDRADAIGTVYLPNALARKYPSAESEWGWQYVFVADRPSVDPRSEKCRRHHVDESCVLESSPHRVARVGDSQAGELPHTAPFLRNPSTRAWRGYTDMQEQLGHSDVRTTQIYMHVLKRGGLSVKSPLGAVLTLSVSH